MSWRYPATLLALVALALGAPGCGGDDDENDATTAPEISVPSGEVQTVPEQTTTQEQPTTTTPQPSGGTPAPSQNYDPSKPDSPENDVPPEPGTPEAKFEQYCRENPGACG
jgi:hypothetical protein